MVTVKTVEPVVSVRLITYNQEAYIAQAIESALAQQTDFPYEIVIGDDFSSDSTAEIVQSYQMRFPEHIRVPYRGRHIGRLNNFVDTLETCRGQYIALLDGDDYWTDPLKLQKQVEFLERRPLCALCFHNTHKLYENEEREPHPIRPDIEDELWSMDDLLGGTFGHTSSIMFRKEYLPDLPDWFFKVRGLDFALSVILAQRGEVAYLNDNMSVYRVHNDGVWSGVDKAERLTGAINDFTVIDQALDFEHSGVIRKRISKTYFSQAIIYIQQGQRQKAKRSLIASVTTKPLNPEIRLIGFLSVVVNILLPQLHTFVKYVHGRVIADS